MSDHARSLIDVGIDALADSARALLQDSAVTDFLINYLSANVDDIAEMYDQHIRGEEDGK